MKGIKRIIFSLPLALMVLTGCSTRSFDECPEDHIVDLWGVLKHSHDFGGDSVYYIINPIAAIHDSLYYNGNYMDSYFRADSTRITVAVGPNDSIKFYFRRMYSVEANPNNMVANVMMEGDSLHRVVCTLEMKRVESSDALYIAKKDTTFLNLLKTEKPLKIEASNAPTAANPAGSQNYSFLLYTSGFNRASEICFRLNNPNAPLQDTVKKDSATLEKAEAHKK